MVAEDKTAKILKNDSHLNGNADDDPAAATTAAERRRGRGRGRRERGETSGAADGQNDEKKGWHDGRNNGQTRASTLASAAIKRQRVAAEAAQADGLGDVEETEPGFEEEAGDGEEGGEEELERSEESSSSSPPSPKKSSRLLRHIHPCICDLSVSQKKRIKAHLDFRSLMRRKYNRRIREIEDELARLEEERLERERELQEQQELYGDEYEVIGSKKKRKKRSARRASMVSLGVKQLINWRKDPKIPVKLTKASVLRKQYAAYCGHRPPPSSPRHKIEYGREPKVKVRNTRAFSLRMKRNNQNLATILKIYEEARKPKFDIPYWV